MATRRSTKKPTKKQTTMWPVEDVIALGKFAAEHTQDLIFAMTGFVVAGKKLGEAEEQRRLGVTRELFLRLRIDTGALLANLAAERERRAAAKAAEQR
jgi:hypothetical protein